jgi:hypothetical protein
LNAFFAVFLFAKWRANSAAAATSPHIPSRLKRTLRALRALTTRVHSNPESTSLLANSKICVACFTGFPPNGEEMHVISEIIKNDGKEKERKS